MNAMFPEGFGNDGGRWVWDDEDGFEIAEIMTQRTIECCFIGLWGRKAALHETHNFRKFAPEILSSSCVCGMRSTTQQRHIPTLLQKSLAHEGQGIAMASSATAFVTPLPLTGGSLSTRSISPPSRSRVSTLRFRRQVTRVVPASCAKASVAQSLPELQQFVEKNVSEAEESIIATTDKQSLEKLRVAYLGKKGTITSVLKSLGKLDPDDRPVLGAAVNKAKNAVAELVKSQKQKIEDEEARKRDENDWIDVTMPGIRPRPTVGRVHPINSTMDLATDIFIDLGYDLIDDPKYNREIETDYYCFEALNCPPDHPAREMQDTFYLKEDKSELLRTQTSAVQIRYMEDHKPPLRIIAPGRVYRRDTVDATHTATFHQIEILALDKIGKLTLGSLKATIVHFLKKMLGEDIDTRFRGSYFPFTEPSLEVDVFFRGEWLEVLGCGMVDPAVLENVGIDPEEYAGFAAGFGVERFAMVMHGITDIRELYKSDLRFIQQGMID